MIEFLSDKSWLAPQIDFLLFLQNIRTTNFPMFDNLFLSITKIGEFWVPALVSAIVYWVIDMKAGIYLFSLSSYNVFVAQIFKMVACVYRPWVLSDKIQPVKKALALAFGYSFPSGHSAQAASLLGGLAFLIREKLLASILLVALVFAVGFSRMWLGVHTPQDVIVGLLIGFSLVFILNYVINWAEENKNRYLYLIGITNFMVLLILLYICYFNSYPVDYINGEILVNPYSSIKATVWCYGYVCGILNGAFLCRRYFPFDTKLLNLKTKFLKAALGSLFLIVLMKFSMIFLTGEGYNFKVAFIIPFLCGLFVTAIYPYVFDKFKNLAKILTKN